MTRAVVLVLIVCAACAKKQRKSEDAAVTAVVVAPDAAPAKASARLLGTWRVSLPELAAGAQGKQRQSLYVIDLVTRDHTPTEEEMTRLGFEGDVRLGVLMTRQLRVDKPDDPHLKELLAEYAALPRITFHADRIEVTAGDQTSSDPYKVISETDREVVIDVDDHTEGKIVRNTATFDGDKLSIIDADDPAPIVLVRDAPLGTPDEAAGYTGPDLTNTPDAAAVIGRWGGEGIPIDLEAGGVSTLHGEGGDLPGEWRLTARTGNVYTIRTRFASFPWSMGNTVEITVIDADHITWRNTNDPDADSMTRRAP